jgi:hypothetical protein
MTPEERRRRLQEIIDQHDQAARALREASIMFRSIAQRMVGAHDAMQGAHEAMATAHGGMLGADDAVKQAAEHADATADYVREVTAAILAANKAALALFNDDASGGPDPRRS